MSSLFPSPQGVIADAPPSHTGSVSSLPVSAPFSGILFWFLLIILAVAASVLVTGYESYSENQAHQFPLMLKLHNPALFPGDPYVDTLRTYVSPVHEVLSYGLRWAGLDTLGLLLFVLSRTLIIVGATWLARAWAGGGRLAPVMAAVFMALNPLSILGEGTILKAYGEHTSLFMGLFLLASALLVQRRFLPAAMVTILAFHANVMYGCYAVTFWAPVLFLWWRRGTDGKKILLFGAAVAVGSAPILYRAIRAGGGGRSDWEFWNAVCRIRLPHHLFPLEWSGRSFLTFGLFTALAAGYIFRQKSSSPVRFERRDFAIWAFVAVGWLGAAFAAAYVLPQLRLVTLHPARATDLWYCLAAMGVIALASVRVEQTGWAGRGLLELVGVMLVLLAFLSPVSWKILAGAALIGGGAAYRWKGCSSAKGPVESFGLVLAAAALVAMAGAGYTGYKRARRSDTRSPVVYATPESLVRMSQWALRNTTPETVFLVPPAWEEFRALARRGVFVTWRDGSAVLWNSPYSIKWLQRLQALGFDPLADDQIGRQGRRTLDTAYDNLTQEGVTALRQRFPVHYWIVHDTAATSLPVVHAESGYKMVLLDAEASDR